MVNRIQKIRKMEGLNQGEFAKKLGLSRNFINQVECGKKNFSDRTLFDICHKFNVREEWLRNGTGEMFESMSKEEQVGSILGNVFTDTESDLYNFKMSVFSELGKLSDSDWEVIQKIVDGIKKE